jgi:3-hydroxyacyl-CoA dehydrogenase
MERVALIGAGAIGRAWAIVFARAGWDVRLQSRSQQTLDVARAFIDDALRSLQEFDLLDEVPAAVTQRIAYVRSIEQALQGATFVQENAPEDVAAKQALFSQLDALCPGDVVIASSTSTLPASRFAAHVAHPQRCLVAHPVNPPYLVPAVEVVPAPFTSAQALARTVSVLRAAGQSPLVLKKEIAGFVMNRLQSLVACEAMRLVEDGCIDVEDLDRAMKDGLGLRWSFMGPLETLDLNAAGGFAAFAATFAPIMHAIDASPEAAPRAWSEAGIAHVHEARRDLVPLSQQADRIRWRDRRLMALLAHRRKLT